jgi:hypothetical protein
MLEILRTQTNGSNFDETSGGIERFKEALDSRVVGKTEPPEPTRNCPSFYQSHKALCLVDLGEANFVDNGQKMEDQHARKKKVPDQRLIAPVPRATSRQTYPRYSTALFLSRTATEEPSRLNRPQTQF